MSRKPSNTAVIEAPRAVDTAVPAEHKTPDVQTPVDTAVPVVKKITAKDHMGNLKLALLALAFFESKSQGSVNKDFDAQIPYRMKGENVDGKDISMSFKSQSKLVKAMKGIENAIQFADLVVRDESVIEGELAMKAKALELIDSLPVTPA